MSRFRLLVMFTLIAGSAGAALAETGEKAPQADPAIERQEPTRAASAIRKSIRSLFVLQDAAAQGHAQSPAVQRAMLTQISAQLLEAAKADTLWLAGDIAGFVLSGGNPRVAERVAQSPALGIRQRRLLNGAGLFMQGQTALALAEWVDLDPSDFSPLTGGRLALARAILAKADNTESQQWLDQAIALMPGTLVEESALRRSALGFGDVRDEHGLWERAERYMRRFPRSLYAEDFLRDLTAKLIPIEREKGALDRGRLDRFAGRLPFDQRRTFFLRICRLAAAAGLGDLTGFAASRLGRLAGPGTVESEMARLYASLYALATDEWNQAHQRLTSIDANRFSGLESALLAASFEVAGQMAAPLPEANPGQAGQTLDGSESEIAERVRSALAAADKLLVEAE